MTPMHTTLAAEAASRSILDYLRSGGPIGLVIVLLSVLAIALAVAQHLRLRPPRISPPDLLTDLRALLSAGDTPAALERCALDRSYLAAVVGSGLRRASRSTFGMLELREALEDAGQHETTRLRRLGDAVGLVATVAPMLGLLGTVVGMVGAFDALSLDQSPARPEALAGSISVALITTVLGLVVAIPCTLLDAALRTRLDDAVADAAAHAEDLASLVTAESSASDSPSAAQAQAVRP